MMSNSWSWFVIILVVLNILAMVWLLLATSRSPDDPSSTTGHRWDGIEELNNPLPRWWLWLFILTIIFSVAYLYLYPGLGNYSGSLEWTQEEQFQKAGELNRQKQEQFFAQFIGEQDIPELAENQRAMETAERLFLNNCATCHGSGARGAIGYPNLVDDDWLYGSDPATIVQSITNGRAGIMPDLALPEASVAVLARYVLHLSGQEVSTHVKQRGKELFVVCASCHGPDGAGMQALGAPNLTDDIWLYGSRVSDIEAILRDGIQGNMPAFSDLLSETEIKLLAAYLISINEERETSP